MGLLFCLQDNDRGLAYDMSRSSHTRCVMGRSSNGHPP